MEMITKAAADVLAERKRQVDAEGWATTHDDQHDTGELALAAACYAAHSASWAAITKTKLASGIAVRTRTAQEFVAGMWPWSRNWWKPADNRRNLVKAGALILAEIERLDRAAEKPKWQTCKRCDNPTYCRESLRGCDLEEMAR